MKYIKRSFSTFKKTLPKSPDVDVFLLNYCALFAKQRKLIITFDCALLSFLSSVIEVAISSIRLAGSTVIKSP